MVKKLDAYKFTLLTPAVGPAYFDHGIGKHILHLIEQSVEQFGVYGIPLLRLIKDTINGQLPGLEFYALIYLDDILLGWALVNRHLDEATIWAKKREIEGIKFSPDHFWDYLTQTKTISTETRIVVPSGVNISRLPLVAKVYQKMEEDDAAD